MIVTARPDPALARAILVTLTARPSDPISFQDLATEAGVAFEDLTPTLDAMERAGQVERPQGSGRIALGVEAARRMKRAYGPPLLAN